MKEQLGKREQWEKLQPMREGCGVAPATMDVSMVTLKSKAGRILQRSANVQRKLVMALESLTGTSHPLDIEGTGPRDLDTYLDETVSTLEDCVMLIDMINSKIGYDNEYTE